MVTELVSVGRQGDQADGRRRGQEVRRREEAHPATARRRAEPTQDPSPGRARVSFRSVPPTRTEQHERPSRRRPPDQCHRRFNNIEVIYDHVILVLKGVSLEVPEGHHRGAAGRQWRGQVDDAEGDLQPAARRARRSHQGLDRIPGRARRSAHAQRPGQARRVPGDGRPALLRPSHGRGEPADRRLHAQRRRDRRRSREGLPLLPAPQGAAHQPGRLHLGRRAADDGGRPRADGAARK